MGPLAPKEITELLRSNQLTVDPYSTPPSSKVWLATY